MSRRSSPLLFLSQLCIDGQYPGRDPEYLYIAEHWTEAAVIKGQIINFLPDLLKPYVYTVPLRVEQNSGANHCTTSLANVMIRSTQSYLKRAMKLLGPTIEYRLSQFVEFGKDWPEKPVRPRTSFWSSVMSHLKLVSSVRSASMAPRRSS